MNASLDSKDRALCCKKMDYLGFDIFRQFDVTRRFLWRYGDLWKTLKV